MYYDVISIGKGAFEGYNSLTSVTLPERIATIEEEAFRGLSGITENHNAGRINSQLHQYIPN